MFRPADRGPFSAAATSVVHYDLPSTGFMGLWWWSTAFKHATYPELTCVIFAGCNDDHDWYGNLLLTDTGEIVAQCSHMAWMEMTELPGGTAIVLENVGNLMNKVVWIGNDVPQEPAGFFAEHFQEYAPEAYCHGFSTCPAER
jgi:hypothetical protein